MLVSPRSFYLAVSAFGPYNAHYARDTGSFYFAFALGSYLAADRPSWRVPVLVMTTAQYAVHVINDAIDVGGANNAWAGPVDLGSLAFATVQLAALLGLLLRNPAATRVER